MRASIPLRTRMVCVLLARMFHGLVTTAQPKTPKCGPLRATKQNRASPECALKDSTLSEPKNPEPEHRLPSPALPGAVLPTSPDQVQRGACDRSGLGGEVPPRRPAQPALRADRKPLPALPEPVPSFGDRGQPPAKPRRRPKASRGANRLRFSLSGASRLCTLLAGRSSKRLSVFPQRRTWP